MRFVIGETEIRIHITAAIMTVFMVISGFAAEYAAAVFSIMLHELSHVLAASACGVKAVMVSVTKLGFSALIPEGTVFSQTAVCIQSDAGIHKPAAGSAP